MHSGELRLISSLCALRRGVEHRRARARNSEANSAGGDTYHGTEIFLPGRRQTR